MAIVTLDQFKQELGKVDFFFEYLDDFTQWKIAADTYRKVEQLANSNPEFKKLFDLKNPFNKINNN